MRLTILWFTLNILGMAFMPMLLLAGGVDLCREYRAFLTAAYTAARDRSLEPTPRAIEAPSLRGSHAPV